MARVRQRAAIASSMRAQGACPIRDRKIPAPNEGARNAGCAQRIRSLVRKCKKHTSIVTTGAVAAPFALPRKRGRVG